MDQQEVYEAQWENDALDEALTSIKSAMDSLKDTCLKDCIDELVALKSEIEYVMGQNERIIYADREENDRALNLEWEWSR